PAQAAHLRRTADVRRPRPPARSRPPPGSAAGVARGRGPRDGRQRRGDRRVRRERSSCWPPLLRASSVTVTDPKQAEIDYPAAIAIAEAHTGSRSGLVHAATREGARTGRRLLGVGPKWTPGKGSGTPDYDSAVTAMRNSPRRPNPQLRAAGITELTRFHNKRK